VNLELLNALDDIVKEKGISKEILLEAIESALLSAYKKDYGSKENVRISMQKETGQVQIFARKEVVEEVRNEALEISLEEARAINTTYEPGDIVEIEITPDDFGRIAAQTAKQVVLQRIREAERDVIYEEFKEKEDELITGLVQRIHNNNIYIDLGKTEALLPPSEQIPGEVYQIGDRIKLYVVEVSAETKGPRILVSRTHPGLLKRLFEVEVPEIFDGIVEIKNIAREAGNRSKIAVHSYDENVDPVGACVGPKGMRVQAVVDQLNGEKIDIIEWNEDPAVFVANALNPAEVTRVIIYEEEKIAEVIVPDFQLSLAIGKEGQNARLAAKLTSWKVDIKKESDYVKEAGKADETVGEELNEEVEVNEERERAGEGNEVLDETTEPEKDREDSEEV